MYLFSLIFVFLGAFATAVSADVDPPGLACGNFTSANGDSRAIIAQPQGAAVCNEPFLQTPKVYGPLDAIKEISIREGFACAFWR